MSFRRISTVSGWDFRAMSIRLGPTVKRSNEPSEDREKNLAYEVRDESMSAQMLSQVPELTHQKPTPNGIRCLI